MSINVVNAQIKLLCIFIQALHTVHSAQWSEPWLLQKLMPNANSFWWDYSNVNFLLYVVNIELTPLDNRKLFIDIILGMIVGLQ